MAVQPAPIPEELTFRPLGPRDGPATWSFLWRGGVKDVFIASQVWRGALEQRLADGTPEITGAFDGGELRALLFFGLGGLAVPAGPDPREVTGLGPTLARKAPALRALVGGRANVEALWPWLEEAGVRARVNVRELFMEVDERTLAADAGEPELRAATLDDLDLLARASARAHLEEMGDDPMARSPEAYLGRVARLVLEERAFLIRRGAELVFKAELSALCPLGAQIAGVYTHPAHRNQGLARRGTAEVARRALVTAPVACLFVREDNAAAVRAYERGGFQHTGDYRTMIFEHAGQPGARPLERQGPAG